MPVILYYYIFLFLVKSFSHIFIIKSKELLDTALFNKINLKCILLCLNCFLSLRESGLTLF